MAQTADVLLMVVMVLGLASLGFSRVSGCIRLVAAQGVLLGLLVILVHVDEISARLVGLALLSILLKGLVFPWLLFRSMREAGIQKEVEPFIGFTLSIVLGTIGLLVAFALARLLPLPHEADSPLIVPISLGMLFTGLLLLVTRRKAVTQVLGYLVMENGIFTFSLILVSELPAMVEMGVLLDLFVAVFVMGITIYQISHEFDHIDASRIMELQDLPGSANNLPFGARESRRG
jgi:hydrogenase-4 component E